MLNADALIRPGKQCVPEYDRCLALEAPASGEQYIFDIDIDIPLFAPKID
jgi:hypothetical protein